MDLMQVPTDNLYKFMAISGIILIVAGFILPSYPLIELTVETDRLSVEAAGLSAKWDTYIGFLEIEVEKVKSGQDLPPEINLEDVLEAVEISAQVSTKVEHMEYYNGIMRDLLKLGCALIFAGILVATWGFRLWYTRLQKYQDEAIRKGKFWK